MRWLSAFPQTDPHQSESTLLFEDQILRFFPLDSWQVNNSKLLTLVKHPRKCVRIFADGTVAWNSAAKAAGMKTDAVSHQLRVFCRPTHHSAGKISGQAGTQCTDRSWGALKPWLPRRLILKIKERGESRLNEEAVKYVYQRMWRQHIMQAAGALKPSRHHVKKIVFELLVHAGF